MVDFYGTAAAARIYLTARGYDTAPYTDDGVVNPALLKASEWLDGRYRGSFPGTKVGMRSQVREWPRIGGFDRDGYSIASDSVPTEIENATYEAMMREIASPGSLIVDWTPNEFKRASVDGAVSVEYATFDSGRDVQTQFGTIGFILAPILCGGDELSPLSGAAVRV